MKKYLLGPFVFVFSFVICNDIAAQDKTSSNETYQVVEEMPRFPGCEDLGISGKELHACAKEKMIQFISSQVKYPEEAAKKKVEGDCVVEFVITKDGSISHVKLLKDIGSGCGEVAVQAIEKMNDMEENWVPGMNKNKATNVRLVMPIKFKLPVSEG